MSSAALPAIVRELRVTSGSTVGDVFELRSASATIGSSDGCEIVIRNPSVQGTHARLESRPDGTLWVVVVSAEGRTLVNGREVSSAEVPDGTFLTIGEVELCLRVKGASEFGTQVRPFVRADTVEVIADALDPGAVIGDRYRVVRKLAEGGMGEVYLAEHVALGKKVALKVLRRALSEDRQFVQRFEREAIAASRIGHQNIADVFDFGRTPDGHFYFAMEYLDGRTLDAELKAVGTLPLQRSLFIVSQVCRALISAHQRGILHRDIKPENIIVQQREGQPDFVKVLDFGIAKINDGGGTGAATGYKTAVGMIVGTPAYMSPEQASGLMQDPRSDIYSLGVVLYELMCGKPPFAGPTPTHVMAAHLNLAPPPLAEVAAAGSLPLALRQMVMKTLAKSPAERPASLQEVAAVIDGTLAELGRAPPVTHTQPLPALVPSAGKELTPAELRAMGAQPGGRARWLLVAGLLALVIGAAVLWPRAGEEPPVVALPAPAPAPPIPAPAPPPVVKPAQITLSLSSSPAGARVLNGKAVLGTTPLSLPLEPGKPVELRFELAGHWAETRALTPQEDAALNVVLRRKARALEPEPEEDPYGAVEVTKESPY